MAFETHSDESARTEQPARSSILAVGVGALLFFTSHMIIRTMYYTGTDKTVGQLVAFFGIVAASVATSHLLFDPLLRFRRIIESELGFPAISACAVAGSLLALASTLPGVPIALFYAAGALLGLACGWVSVVWMSTLRFANPNRSSYRIHLALLVAIGSYFLFRLASTFSSNIADGFMLALPLVAIACILQEYKRLGEGANLSEVDTRSTYLQSLVIIAAVFALGCALAAFAAGNEEAVFPSALNAMAFLEVLAIAAIAGCAFVMGKFLSRQKPTPTGLALAVTLLVAFAPLFLLGIVMGEAAIPNDPANALWEVNIWVLIVVVFAYDVHDSLYVMEGVGIGIMFEALCFGQLVAKVASAGAAEASAAGALPAVPALAVALTIVYFAGVSLQITRQARTLSGADAHTAGEADAGGGAHATRQEETAPAAQPSATERADETRPSVGAPADANERQPDSPPDDPVDIAEIIGGARTADIARESRLTEREREIFELIAMGRSATYIADELTISYHTTRTHIKHVYEKLGVHSKQELIDLVLYR